MTRPFGRLVFIVAVLSAVVLACARPAVAQVLQHQRSFNIPAQDLSSALLEYSKQSDVIVVVPPHIVAGKRASEVIGVFTPREALEHLLEGTGLKPELSPKGGFTLTQVSVKTSSATDITATRPEERSSPPNPVQLEGIVVTAQKREERLQNVPVPVTVLNADKLADNGQVLLRDYYASVPGFTVTQSYQGNQYLTIRGIATGGTTTPTVGVLIDDVPFGSSTTNGGSQFPDIDPGDLARIEVLRGPQGTLYGANSMGGLLKFVTKDPSPDGYSGRVEAGVNSVDNGTQAGFNIRVSANIPLGSTLAMRASAFKRQDPGYINNPITHVNGVNEAQSDGARLSALWKPSDDLSLKLSALYQNIKAKGQSQVDIVPGLGDLQQKDIPGTSPFDKTFQAYSAIVNYKLGNIDLTSVTGYNIDRHGDNIDLSAVLGGFAQTNFGVGGSIFHDFYSTKKITQEVRLSGSIGNSFDWLVGGFYAHEKFSFNQHIYAANTTSGNIAGLVGFGAGVYINKEIAGFADLTYHVTDRFDIQVGGRESHSSVDQQAGPQLGPLFGAPTTIFTPAAKSSANAFTFLVTPKFKLTPDFMVYARVASGYRPGGPNQPAAVAQGAPPAFTPDKTNNYEVGIKGDFLNHMISIDASLYYIDWKSIQIKLTTPSSFGYSGNGGDAKSEGAELSLAVRPWTGMTVSGWVVYDKAVVTHPPARPGVYLFSGERLAYSSKWSGNLSLEQKFPLWSDVTGYVGGEVSFVGDRVGPFTGNATTAAPRQDFPAYTRADLRAGARYDTWTANIYVNNVGNVRGLVGGGIGFNPNYAFVYIQPRTVGLNLVKTF